MWKYKDEYESRLTLFSNLLSGAGPVGSVAVRGRELDVGASVLGVATQVREFMVLGGYC